MKTTKTAYAYVYRAIGEEERVDGYLAKVIRPKHRLHKIFNFKGFGGDPAACLQAAREAVTEFVALHPRLTRQQLAELPRQRKNSDLPIGVRRITKKFKGHFYNFYQASWSPIPNHHKNKSFSVNFWGEEEAKELAIEARILGLAEMTREDAIQGGLAGMALS